MESYLPTQYLAQPWTEDHFMSVQNILQFWGTHAEDTAPIKFYLGQPVSSQEAWAISCDNAQWQMFYLFLALYLHGRSPYHWNFFSSVGPQLQHGRLKLGGRVCTTDLVIGSFTYHRDSSTGVHFHDQVVVLH